MYYTPTQRNFQIEDITGLLELEVLDSVQIARVYGLSRTDFIRLLGDHEMLTYQRFIGGQKHNYQFTRFYEGGTRFYRKESAGIENCL